MKSFSIIVGDPKEDFNFILEQVVSLVQEGFVHVTYPNHGWSDKVVILSKEKMTQEESDDEFMSWQAQCIAESETSEE